MHLDERIVAIIPARGGSKSIPRKNLVPLFGKPLIAWSIEAALQSALVDRIIVSTDDTEIADISRSFGAEVYVRPPELSTDTAVVADAIKHLIQQLEVESESSDCFLLLEPTCPLRTSVDIDACIAALVDQKFDAVATFIECDHHPYRSWQLSDSEITNLIPDVNPWLPRQLLPKAFRLNGAVYCFRRSALFSSAPGLFGERNGWVLMPEDRSVDIDTMLDFQFAEMLLEHRHLAHEDSQ